MKKINCTVMSQGMAEYINGYFSEKEMIDNWKSKIADGYSLIAWQIADNSHADEVKKWHELMHTLTCFKDIVDMFYEEVNS